MTNQETPRVKFIVDTQAMCTALSKLLQLSATKDNREFYVAFGTSPCGLIMRSYNLAFGAETCIDARIAFGGAGRLTAKQATLLAQLLQRLPMGEVFFEVYGSDLTIRQGDSRMLSMPIKLLDGDCDTFKREGCTPTTSLTLQQSELAALLKSTLYAACADISRPHLKVVNFKVNGETLSVAATDGSQLAVATTTAFRATKADCCTPADNFNTSIHDSVLRFILPLLKSESKLVTLTLDDKKHADFNFGAWKIFSRIVDGTFPTYQKLTPAEDFAAPVSITVLDQAINDKQCVPATNILRNAIKLCKPALDEFGTLTITTGTFNTSRINGNLGSAKMTQTQFQGIEIKADNGDATVRVTIPARITGTDNGSAVFNVNANRLLAVLGSLSDSIVSFELTKEYVLIREENAFAITAPTRKGDIEIALPQSNAISNAAKDADATATTATPEVAASAA